MDGANQNNQQSSWQYNPDKGAPQAVTYQPQVPSQVPQDENDSGVITWTASEFVAHDKTTGWYAKLAVAAIIAAVVTWFITKDAVTSVVIVVAAIMFGVFAARQPREMLYRLDSHGLMIGQRYIAYNEFKSFAIVDEGAFSSIVFTPHKRFLPLTTIYYDPQDEIVIADLLSQYLPVEQRKRDAIDRLMWRIRF